LWVVLASEITADDRPIFLHSFTASSLASISLAFLTAWTPIMPSERFTTRNPLCGVPQAVCNKAKIRVRLNERNGIMIITILLFNPSLREIDMNQEAFEKGLKTRREVLGAEYVDQSIKNADDFNMPMQELVTEYCWNEIWNRPGLDRKTRSIVNLAMITALNRPHELKLHVKGAINNGLTKEEIREIFLQTASYCGVPAAIDSFRNAKEVFREMGI
jgi:4-carboxymuconolactone decarboxylase